jgi:pimeloyl-ACP methyl ester carboxylesterase
VTSAEGSFVVNERNVSTRTVGSGTSEVTYDVHGDLGDATADRPVLMMIGSPMDAVGFGSLASRFIDRPVVTYDPRGAGRNSVDTTPVTPEEHAEDLHRVIQDLGVGPVDLFASSGGAVNALRLVELHPDDVNRLVAHEPPTTALLPDREAALAALRDMVATYQSSGSGPAMAKFIKFVMYDGQIPDDYVDQPAPDPAMFGLPAEDDGSRTDPLMRNMPWCNEYQPDFEALKGMGDRLVIAVGKDSGQQLAARGGRSVAQGLGREPVVYPSDHGGFLGGEYGQHGDPDGFAAALRASLD